MGLFKAADASAEITRLSGLVATLQAAAEKHAEQLAAKDKEFKLAADKHKEEITTLNGTITTLTGERDTAKTEVTRLQGEAKNAEERAQQILAGMGINQAVRKDETDKEGAASGKTEDQLWNEYEQISDPAAKRAFFLKHQAVLGK